MAKIQNGWQWILKNLDSLTGTKNGVGVSSREISGGVRKTVLTFTNTVIPTTDATTAGAYGSLKIYDFPEGSIAYLGGTTNLTIVGGAGLTPTAALVGGVGTVAAAADATLTGTEQNLIPSTAATLASSAGTFKGKSLTATTAVFDDGVTTAKDAFLNFAVVDAGSTANSTITVNGTITLLWAHLGDN